MPDPLDPSRALDELRRHVHALEDRVLALEGIVRLRTGAAAKAAAAAPRAGAAPAEGSRTEAAATPVPAVHPDVTRSVPLVGKLLLVLAGAYVLRAASEGGQIPVAAGAAAGLAYALVWLFLADRAGRRGRAWDAGFHAVASAVVAFPLVVESMLRFRLVSPPAAACVVGALGAAGLLSATRRRTSPLAWVYALGAVAAGSLVSLQPAGAVPGAVLVVLVATATRWIARVRGWTGLAWVPGLAADAAVFTLTSMTLGPRAAVPVGAALAVQALFVATELGGVSAFLLALRRRLEAFDVVQTAAALAIGVRGAASVVEATGTGRAALGAVGLTLGLVAYVVAFRVVRRDDRGAFYWFTTVAFALVVLGSFGVLEHPSVPWSVLAVLTAAVGSRRGRIMASLHGAAYAAAAIAESGLVGHAAAAWTSKAPGALGLPMALALAATAVVAWLPTRTDNPYWRGLGVLPRLLCVALLVVAGGGAVVGLLAGLLPRGGEGGPDLALLSALRTGVISLATVAVAWVTRRGGLRPGAWFVVPLLAIVPIKLLVEDLPRGRAATLAISFVLYGSALLAAPRIARLRAATAPPADGPPPA